MTKTSTIFRHDILAVLCALAVLSLAAGTGPARGEETPGPVDIPELQALYEADQADRSGSMHDMDWEKVSKRDAERRERVMELMEAGEVRTAADYYHAAMVFQHGSGTEDIRRARDWAKKATELAEDRESRLYRQAIWLHAAATDRHLQRQGKPQIYGTQYLRPSMDGPWTQEPFDRDAVTPGERAAHGVPPLEKQEERLREMNEELRRRGLLKDDEASGEAENEGSGNG